MPCVEDYILTTHRCAYPSCLFENTDLEVLIGHIKDDHGIRDRERVNNAARVQNDAGDEDGVADEDGADGVADGEDGQNGPGHQDGDDGNGAWQNGHENVIRLGNGVAVVPSANLSDGEKVCVHSWISDQIKLIRYGCLFLLSKLSTSTCKFGQYNHLKIRYYRFGIYIYLTKQILLLLLSSTSYSKSMKA